MKARIIGLVLLCVWSFLLGALVMYAFPVPFSDKGHRLFGVKDERADREKCSIHVGQLHFLFSVACRQQIRARVFSLDGLQKCLVKNTTVRMCITFWRIISITGRNSLNRRSTTEKLPFNSLVWKSRDSST